MKKKYFMQGTANEVKFGDMINLDLTKELPNGNVQHHHLECKFIPELVPILLEEGIIEEQHPKETKPSESCNEHHDAIKELWKALDILNERISATEDMVMKLSSMLTSTSSAVPNSHKPCRNAKKAGRK